MTLKDYYSNLNNSGKNNFKDKVMTDTGFSEKTVYRYINGDTPDLLTMKYFSELTGVSVNELFPTENQIV